MTSTDGKPVIVSLTPLPLSADSRTLKQVTSVDRFGLKSIVIEGKPSGLAQELMPLEVISVGADAKANTISLSSAVRAAQTEIDAQQSGGLAQEVVPIEIISVGADAKANTISLSSAVRAAQTEIDSQQSAPSAPCAGAVRNVESLSRLRQSGFGQFFDRRMPWSSRAAHVFHRCLVRAIVSLRSPNRISEKISANEVLLAIPFATWLLATEIVVRLRISLRFATGIAVPLRAGLRFAAGIVVPFRAGLRFATSISGAARSTLANPRAFARHLAIYFGQYFFRVLAVTPRADIYYVHAFYQFPAVCILCLWHRAKMIYDAHDFYSQMEDDASYSSYWKNWVMPFERVVERACVWFADDVVTVNEGIAALMRERFGCEPVILRNAHDLRLDRQPATTIREAMGLLPGAFLVVSIGNWKNGMAVEQMFDALAELPKHVHLAFLGSGYPPLDEAISSRGLDGRVHILRPVPPQEVVPFIASADASVILYHGKSVNYQNALPNRFFQSIAAELPLVYPDLKEIRRLADRYGAGIMANPQNPTDIRSALQVLIENSERRAAIRRNLRLANQDLCWEHEECTLKVLLNRHLGVSAMPISPVENRVVG
jgi:glycosyltransferase involved in cell wall biosynthesis